MLAVALLTFFVLVPVATAKEDVHAVLESSLALNARPGSTITVKWRLYSRADGRPFGASEVFVRLRSRGGGAPKRAYGTGRNGRYTARVKVPRGGMGGIRFGLMGYRTYPGGETEAAPVYFSLDNDPF